MRQTSTRAGFTLIELMVVIIIIAVLVALLLPAIQGARRRVRVAEVKAEIAQIDSAIVAFKTKYGVEPPSRITLYLDAAGWNGDLPGKAIIKRIWPQFDFTMPSGSYPATWTAPQSMNSGECLLFFLGGVIEEQGGVFTATGFARDPSRPFAPRSVVSNREGPFMEFASARIVDSDSNGIREYVDTIPGQKNPYLYFSSYEGSGYRVSGTQNELPSGGTLADVYRVGGASAVPGAATFGLVAHKAQSWQLISPGFDGEYGMGGVYNPELAASGLHDPQGRDRDNITNFAGGELAP